MNTRPPAIRAAEVTAGHSGQSVPPGITTDVLIVGAGPAGLAAGVELRRLGAGSVVIADRDDEAGGIPRHSAHSGFGARDLRRVLTGPRYARHYADAAAAAGADIRLGTTVTGWGGPRRPGADRHRGHKGGAASDRVPGAAADRAPGPRRSPAGGDDHRGTPAQGVPG